MKQDITDKLALFVNSTREIQQKLKLRHFSMEYRLSALLYAIKNMPADCEAIAEGRALVKKNAPGIFSAFKGPAMLPVATIEAQAYLRAQKGFGKASVSTQELLLYSSAIISSVYTAAPNENMTATSVFTTSVVNTIIATQIAIIIAIVVASTSATAAAG